MTQRYRIALIALPILFSGSGAMAIEDNKVYPGAMCQTSQSTDRVERRANDGSMVNPTNARQVWICPFDHDAETADGVEFAAITLIGTNVTARSCTFHSMRVDGSQVIGFTAGNIAMSGNNSRLQYASGDQDIRNTSNGYYYFECTIQPSSGVLTYTVDENVNEG